MFAGRGFRAMVSFEIKTRYTSHNRRCTAVTLFRTVEPGQPR